MSLVRPDQRGSEQGLIGFTALVRALRASDLPIVFLPGVIHLPTVPVHRKINRIDLGTPDKLCVAALALAQHGPDGCVVELGSAFTACVVLGAGRVVDGLGGSSGPPGWRAGGAWDGEATYLLGPLTKRDLFTGGVRSVNDAEAGRTWFREGLVKAVAGLRAVTPFEQIVLSGRLLEEEPALAAQVAADLGRLAAVRRLESLPGAWVKQAAQGAALLADGLAGGKHRELVERLALRAAGGTVLDWLCYPAAEALR
jgi:predicted butyrate kinase (DUF1464 family)